MTLSSALSSPPYLPTPSAEINFSHGQLLIFIDFHAPKEAIFFAALSSRPIYTWRADAWPGENREMGVINQSRNSPLSMETRRG